MNQQIKENLKRFWPFHSLILLGMMGMFLSAFFPQNPICLIMMAVGLLGGLLVMVVYILSNTNGSI